MAEPSDKLHFQVDARLITQLGRQLVPSDLMALAELVKNSYDADATIALIDYFPDGDDPRLVVEDDGSGMRLDDLKNGWMVIGTAFKEEHVESPKYGRPRAGRKGIGRFAAQRMARHLHLWTTVAGSPAALEVDFDWDAFRPGVSIEEVQHDVRMSPAKPEASGTRLTLRGLREPWNKSGMVALVKDLVTLRSGRAPRADDDPGFEIAASFHGERIEVVDEVDLLRKERVMSVHGRVDVEGKGTFVLEFVRPEHEPLEDEYADRLATGPMSFHFDLFSFDADNVREFGVRKAQLLARKHGGARVRRDGFRVMPYGDPGDDWLGLDAHAAARRIPLNMWRSQTVMGYIELTRRDNPEFEDLLTRRGVVETPAFEALRKFIFFVLHTAASEYGALTIKETRTEGARVSPSDELRRVIEQARAEREALRMQRTDAKKAAAGGQAQPAPGDDDVAGYEKVTREGEERMIRAVEATVRPLLDENEMLRVLASLGTGLAAFSHELRGVMQPMALVANDLQALLRTVKGSLAEPIGKAHDELRAAIDTSTSYRRYIDDFVTAGSRRERDPVELAPFVESLTETFKPLLQRRHIDVASDIPRGLFITRLHRAEMNSVVFNLLTNALKALEATVGSERRLRFHARQADGAIIFQIADTGCGIPAAISGRLFDPFVSRSHSADQDLGMGTGLGLFLVKQIVSENGGVVSVVSPPAGFCTAFEVRLPVPESPR